MSSDWAKAIMNIAYSYHVNLRPDSAGSGGYDIGPENIIPSGKEIFNGLTEVCREARYLRWETPTPTETEHKLIKKYDWVSIDRNYAPHCVRGVGKKLSMGLLADEPLGPPNYGQRRMGSGGDVTFPSGDLTTEIFLWNCRCSFVHFSGDMWFYNILISTLMRWKT